MNKYLAQNKVYNYFDVGDAKTLVKFKKKKSKLFFISTKTLVLA